jgi:N-methylhydantoinase A/oxoprolinase/acetone carboxylase beta subunit
VRIGIDVGGTHTDAVVLIAQEVVASTKVLTSANVKDGVINALDEILANSSVDRTAIEAVMIGTTQSSSGSRCHPAKWFHR